MSFGLCTNLAGVNSRTQCFYMLLGRASESDTEIEPETETVQEEGREQETETKAEKEKEKIREEEEIPRLRQREREREGESEQGRDRAPHRKIRVERDKQRQGPRHSVRDNNNVEFSAPWQIGNKCVENKMIYS